MTKRNDTLVFIPAWNEEQNIAAVLHELRTELPDADVLVVDDGSTDRTPHIAREQGAEVLSFGENRGLRAAIAAGYGYAAEHGYEYCGRVDADGSILWRSPEADRGRARGQERRGRWIAVRHCRRKRLLPGAVQDLPARRPEPGLRRSMEVVLDRPFHDATSGMYAVNAKAMPILAQPYTSGARGGAVLRLHDEGLRVDEHPVEMRERASGESKLQGKKALVLVLTVAGTLITAEALRRRRR